MKLGVALLPDAKNLSALIALQAKLSAIVPLEPLLSDAGNLPHVSLLQANAPENWEGQDRLDAIVKSAGKLRDLNLTLDTLFIQPPDWLFLGVKRSQGLSDLQEIACEQLGDLLGPPKQFGPNYSTYSPAEKESYERYGYRYIGKSFLPHFTLGRLSSPDVPLDILRKIFLRKSLARRMRVRTITIYRAGQDGAHAETLWEHTFPNKGWF